MNCQEEKKIMEDSLMDHRKCMSTYSLSLANMRPCLMCARLAPASQAHNTTFLARPSQTWPTVLCFLSCSVSIDKWWKFMPIRPYYCPEQKVIPGMVPGNRLARRHVRRAIAWETLCKGGMSHYTNRHGTPPLLF